nr:class I SAM-dependent methyltransferase [Streptomyces olivoverticillatus]
MPPTDIPGNASSKTSYVTVTFDRALTAAEVEQLRRSTDAKGAVRLPPDVGAAYERESLLGFEKSSRPEAGALLSVLAAAVPPHGRVLEIGTGAGVGLAWITHGVGARDDVEVVSIELDGELAAAVARARWPRWVRLVEGDAREALGRLGSFDLLFLDAPGIKTQGLSEIVAALRPGGVLLVDDMAPDNVDDPAWRDRNSAMRERIFGDPLLVCAELTYSSGLILATRRTHASLD